MSDHPAPSNSSWRRTGIAVLGTALGLAAAIAAVRWVMDQSDRRDPRLGQLALALRAHNDQRGRLPPAFVYGPDGRLLLSWRVLLLPTLGETELYNEFRLEQAVGQSAQPGLAPADARHLRPAPLEEVEGPAVPHRLPRLLGERGGFRGEGEV